MCKCEFGRTVCVAKKFSQMNGMNGTTERTNEKRRTRKKRRKYLKWNQSKQRGSNNCNAYFRVFGTNIIIYGEKSVYAHTETFSLNKLSATAPAMIQRRRSVKTRWCWYRFQKGDNFHWPFVLCCRRFLFLGRVRERWFQKWLSNYAHKKSSLFWLLFATIDRNRKEHIFTCHCWIDSFSFNFSYFSFDTFHVIHAADDNANQHSHRLICLFFFLFGYFLLKLMRVRVYSFRVRSASL